MQPNFEQYMTASLTPIASVLDKLDLRGRTTIEIGVGEGALTRLLLDRGAAIIGYEIDSTITPQEIKDKICMITKDFNQCDFEYAKRNHPLLVANPPYLELAALREKIILGCDVQDYILFIPAAQRMLFPEAEVVAVMEGKDFNPPALGQHLIIQHQRSSAYKPVSTVGISWSDLKGTDLSFAPPSAIEESFIKNMTMRARQRITNEKPIVFLLTEDQEKIKRIQENMFKDQAQVIHAELYSHPQYIGELLKISAPTTIVLRPVSSICVSGFASSTRYTS